MESIDAIDTHFRLTPAHKRALRRLGIHTLGDLLYHFPTRYEAAGQESTSRELAPGAKVTLTGVVTKLEAKKLWKSRRTVTEGWFEDKTGKVKLMWFNQPYMASYVPQNQLVRLTGTVGGKGKPYIANAEVEKVSATEMTGGLFSSSDKGDRLQRVGGNLFPVYPESSGVTSKWFYHALRKLFEQKVHEQLEDPIPADVREQLHLPELATALIWIHQPENEKHAAAARKRFSFEEMFVLQASRALERAQNNQEGAFTIADGAPLAEEFLKTLPVSPTGAQRRAIAQILADLGKPSPMARLLEGDVGSGKTLVAAACSYAVVNSRPPNRKSGTLQVAYMAPTEILAQQHFESFIAYFKHLPINIALMTGSGCKKFPSKVARGKATDISRSQLLKWVASGEIAMVVGTHALIQKSVQFQHLALAIVDEQHRFGTRQRRELAHKPARQDARLNDAAGQDAGRSGGGSHAPHFLSMTATPIPRTLALTIYGDLDISVLDELPPGRVQITTKIVQPNERAWCYEQVRKQLQQGRQAYVICPRIDEPDPAKLNALQAKSAKAEAKRLKKEVFPEYEIGLLHGAMKPKEKDEVMKEFEKGALNILVATSVVEVGVNVPNATVILIEGAERFGLAQLHQLRGRVQRSSHPPFCYLLPESRGEVSMRRLKALEKSSDGFQLAETDLEARGPGDFYGRQQWGISDLGMEALKNPRLIEAARDAAQQLIGTDSKLLHDAALAQRIANIGRELHEE